MSSLAQEESRSIPQNVTWGQRKRMADGKVSFAYSRFLGLDKDKETGKIVVNSEQAETVRLIFHLFLEGMTPYSIAAELTVDLVRSERLTDILPEKRSITPWDASAGGGTAWGIRSPLRKGNA